MPRTPRSYAGRVCRKDRIHCKLYFNLRTGASFPRCENLILLLNALEVSADAIFCDVLDHTTEYKATQLSNELGTLSVDAQNRILQIVELLIRQEKENEK